MNSRSGSDHFETHDLVGGFQDPVLEFQQGSERAVARVFFTYEGDHVKEMRGLPLQNHLSNVATLAHRWSFEEAFGSHQCPPELQMTHSWLAEAARRHDEGKMRRFTLRRESPHHFTYSFSGHRFDVSDDRLYVQWLIRLHHGFSVQDVTEAQARLKQSGDAALAAVAHCFPLDLYALEMCDQIEAEAASRAFGQVGDHRVFMEFEVEELPSYETLCLNVFPYPFAEQEVRFALESFVVAVPEHVKQDETTLKQWLLKDGVVVREEHKEILLCKAK